MSLLDSLKGIGIIGIMTIHLGQWNLNFADGSRIAVARSAGLLGVEITYLINAFLYSKKYYDSECFGVKTILKMFLGLIPVYWLGLLVYGISTYISFGYLKDSIPNILSHFFFVNGIYCPWWQGFMGGSGYFGVLAILWCLYPIILKQIINLRESIVIGCAVIASSYLISKSLVLANNIILFDTTGSFGDFMWYIYRGIYCFVLGNILYYLIKEKKLIVINSIADYVAICIFIIMILAKMIIDGSRFDGLLFTLLIGVTIYLNYQKSTFLIDNPVWSFFGKNITELFVAHVVLYYVLVRNHSIFTAGTVTFFILFCMSIVIAPILKYCFSDPVSKFLIKISKC